MTLLAFMAVELLIVAILLCLPKPFYAKLSFWLAPKEWARELMEAYLEATVRSTLFEHWIPLVPRYEPDKIDTRKLLIEMQFRELTAKMYRDELQEQAKRTIVIPGDVLS